MLIGSFLLSPFLTVGYYKNKRYENDATYRARIDAMNENPDAEKISIPVKAESMH